MRFGRLLGFAVAVASTAAAFAVSVAVPELAQTCALLFLGAVTLSAWYGGLTAGLLATIISALLLDYFFVHEIYAVDLGPAVYVSLAVFVGVALLINSLNAVRRRLESVLRVQDRRKAEFMAVLAHELRNFLTPIASTVGALRIRRPGDEVVEQTCAAVDRQVRNMTRLVDDLLDIVRINEGKVQLRTEPVDLAAVVAQAVEDTRPLMEARRHHLETTVPDGPIPVDADRTRLEQVFVNLLTNAAKYTDTGGWIRLAIERQGDELVIRVRDNGRGLAPEMLPHVFDLFMQADAGAHGGLGVGLNLVRHLVAMHGGTVTAHSAGPGRGSEFVVRLPATRYGANMVRSVARPLEAASAGQHH